MLVIKPQHIKTCGAQPKLENGKRSVYMTKLQTEEKGAKNTQGTEYLLEIRETKSQ